jgi:F-type H+-transporting ATPase subunit delta
MSDMTTIARPYAKAIFEYALATKQLAAWSSILQGLAYAVTDSLAKSVIDNPSTTTEQKNQLLLSALGKTVPSTEHKAIENLVHLLAANKRLLILADVSVQYEALRAEQEKTLMVQVCSFSSLSTVQQQNLIQSLSQRLQRQISLDITIDTSLLGGAVIRAGDLVIDGSVRGKLNKLSTNIAA